MAKNKRTSTTNEPTPTPVRIEYIHPVKLLLYRLDKAIVAVSGLPYSKDFDSTIRAIDLARGAAIDIAPWLRFGRPDRAGVIETDLRTGLDYLKTGACHVSGNGPPPAQRQCWDAYDKLEQLRTELQLVVIEQEPPIAWPKKLRGFHTALLRVKDAMGTLYEAAEGNAKDPVALWEHIRRTVLPDFDKVAADILPQLVYAADVWGIGDLYLDGYPVHIFYCCQELMCWGKARRDRPKEDIRFEPSGAYRAAQVKGEWLLEWIGNDLKVGEADKQQGRMTTERLGPSDDGSSSTPDVHAAIVRLTREVEELQEVPVAPPLPNTISNQQAAKTADAAVKRLGSDWATYKQLSEVTGLSENQLRGAVRTARKSEHWLPQLNEHMLSEAGPRSSKKEFRVRALWHFLPAVRARAQD